MAARPSTDLRGSARAVERALQLVEAAARSLRQKLLARQLARTAPASHWVASNLDEDGLTADDLRRHANEVRHKNPE